MDLMLANLITISFFVGAITVERQLCLIKPKPSCWATIALVAGLLLALLSCGVLLASLLAATLAEIYVNTFSYKLILVSPVLLFYWSRKSWQVQRQQRVTT
ncbi:hypothetical protein ACFO3I_04075 [Rheinheimera marina]|uniref:Uncharacterized protein n=1 Tax=Rheinheimera marina TaxID=1774958 RepID=A0ABV9JJP3_9GAMM